MIASLANHLWQSTVFGIAMAVLALAFCNSRAYVRFGLWLSASLKFLIPFSLLLGFGGHLAPATSAPKPARIASVAILKIAEPLPQFIVPAQSEGNRRSWIPIMAFGLWAGGFAVASFRRLRSHQGIRNAVEASRRLDIALPVEVRATPALLEPGVFGVWDPIILLPADIMERLTPAQFEAVVAHELCHIRRRDNLIASIHMVVEALFWFHPFVWWIGARLVEERERACDETVLSLGSKPRDYAEGILSICKIYFESPLRSFSGASGSDLRKRIQNILTGRIAGDLTLGNKALLALTAGLAFAGPIIVGALNAPSILAQPAVPLQFEVATIKPFEAGQRQVTGGLHMDGAQIRAAALSLKDYLSTAYNIKALLISGPSWTETDRFDLTATLPAGSRPAQVPEMLRALLAERFQVKMHQDKKEFPVYALVTGKGALKLKEVPPDPDAQKDETRGTFNNATIILGDGVTIRYADGGSFYFGNNRVEAKKLPMAEFTRDMERFADRQIVDMTGLKGQYDFAFTVTPEDSQAMTLRSLMWVGQRLTPQAQQLLDASPPSALSDNMQQVGLKLEPRKAPLDVLVIDSALRTPIPN
jgi:bla regulator protein blaR1